MDKIGAVFQPELIELMKAVLDDATAMLPEAKRTGRIKFFAASYRAARRGAVPVGVRGPVSLLPRTPPQLPTATSPDCPHWSAGRPCHRDSMQKETAPARGYLLRPSFHRMPEGHRHPVAHR
jgi:hypothetical protein